MRARVLEAVRSFPGIHVRGLVRQLGTSLALVQYHLKALKEERLLREVVLGHFTRYFPVESFAELSPKERKVLQVLRRERPLEIVLALLEFGPQPHGELAELAGMSRPALSYHLDHLVEAGIVDRASKGVEKGFSLRDPAGVRKLLARHEPAPDVLANVSDTWDDLFRGHRAARLKEPED